MWLCLYADVTQFYHNMTMTYHHATVAGVAMAAGVVASKRVFALTDRALLHPRCLRRTAAGMHW